MTVQSRLPIGSITLVSASLLSILGGGGPAHAADCLAAPGASVPPNGHWYYRTDPTTQRKCWFLRGGDASAQSNPPQSSSPQSDPPQSNPPQADPPQAAAAAPDSLASFKDFIAQRGHGSLSDQDVKRLYAQFLAWRHRPENEAKAHQ